MKLIEFDKIAYSSINYAYNNIDIVRLSYFEAEDNWRIPFHKHIFYEFHYILEGIAYTKFRDTEIEAGPGDFYIMQPNLIHAHYQTAKSYHKAFSMAWKMEPIGCGGSIYSVFNDITSDLNNDNGIIRREIENLMKENEEDMPHEILKLDVCRLIYSLAGMYGNLKPLKYKKNLANDIVDEAMVFMNDNIEKDIRATDISDAVHVSYAHLSRLFDKVLGSSVKKIYRGMKMQKAKDLLNHTELTIEKIALQSGFMNLNYFYDMFKKEIGLTPNEFRRSNKNIVIKSE